MGAAKLPLPIYVFIAEEPIMGDSANFSVSIVAGLFTAPRQNQAEFCAPRPGRTRQKMSFLRIKNFLQQ